MFRIPKDTELTLPLLQEFLDKHRREVNGRYKRLHDAYTSDHDILHQAVKPRYKPDNRILVNFPKYIVDTMNGFFMGNPVKNHGGRRHCLRLCRIPGPIQRPGRQ